MLLSVLDQSPIRAGGTAADAVAETLELAHACDRWGYHRDWLSITRAEGSAGSYQQIAEVFDLTGSRAESPGSQ